MVEYTLDAPPALTAEHRREMEKLAALPDGRIDTSDIAELSEAQWVDAVRGRFYRPMKRQITARLNTILRRAMLTETKRGG